MLAQAVEGQQNEQRELSNALTDMRNQLLRLGQEIAELRAARGEAATDPSVINNITVELRESVRFLSERLDGVTRMVAQRGEELADVRGALSAVDAHIRSQTETLGVLSQGLQALPSYGERVSALHDAINAVNSRLAGLEAGVAKSANNSAVVPRLAAIESQLGPLGEQLAQSRQVTATALAEQSATLAQQAESLAAHRASLNDLREQMAAVAAGTQAALAVPPVFDETTIQGIESTLSSLAADVAALSDRDSVHDTVRDAEDRLRSHIDDAVLALAEILVRRRPPATADQITGTPLSTSAAPATPATPAPSVAPTAAPSYPQPVVADPEPVGLAPLGLPADDPDVDTPIVDFSAAEFADEDGDAAPADAAEDDLEDEYDEDEYDEDEYDEEYDEYADDSDSGAEVEADEETDDLDSTSEIHFPPVAFPDIGVLDPPTPPHEPAPWAPEVPPERSEPEPSSGGVSPEEDRKRRWFSR